jgi:Kdo2-lipid IVA lauroyltransferase/acyltransferase
MSRLALFGAIFGMAFPLLLLSPMVIRTRCAGSHRTARCPIHFGREHVNISRFFQARPNVFLFMHAPVWMCTRYLEMLGYFYFMANRRERSRIERSILTVFENRKDARHIIRRAFKGIFSHYSEKLIMAHRNYAILKRELNDAMEYSGLGYLDSALKSGGVVLITGHFGGVEFMPLSLALRGYPVTMIVNFQTERLRESLMQRAAEVNVELIDSHSDRVMYQAISSLKRGRILLTECDEVDAWKHKGHETIQAFGGNVRLDRTLETICRRTHSTAIGSFMVRTGKGYRLTIVPVAETDSGEEEDMSAAIFRMFERFVMTFPDQWYQWSKFHKMRPESA